MKEVFLNNLQRLVPTYKKAKFLLAVSGGIDSTVMAHLFAESGLDFAVAHCNFHLRGFDSDADMEFVKQLPFIQDKELLINEFDTFSIQKNSGKSIEMVARELRYAWFNELLQRFDYVCTAHHANDNAETLLLNLVRGSGYKGINAIPAINGRIIRPMLSFSSEEIQSYSLSNHILYRIDKTNTESKYQRNKIRHSVIPILQEINPDLIHTFDKNIRLFNQQYHFYTHYMHKMKVHLLQKTPQGYEISIEDLITMEDFSLILYEILIDFGFNASVVDNILTVLRQDSGKIFYSDDYQLIKDRNILYIYPLHGAKLEEIEISDIEEMRVYGFNVEVLDYQPDIKFDNSPDILYVDAMKCKFPLVLRKWKVGDYFYPFGMKGKKKLSDFFVDKKLNLYQKQQVRLMCSGGEIVWIIGMRGDNRFRITGETHRYYKISVKKDANE